VAAFAGALALVALLISVALLVRPMAGDEVTMPTDATRTDRTRLDDSGAGAPRSAGVEVGAPGSACPAEDAATPRPQDELPAPVAGKRDQIIAVLLACDVDGLRALTNVEIVDPFASTESELTLSSIDRLREPVDPDGGSALPITEVLLRILDMPVAQFTFADGEPGFVWPAALLADSWEVVAESDLTALRTAYPDPEGHATAFGYDSYGGWRIGITAAGQWRTLGWGPLGSVDGETPPTCVGSTLAAPGPQTGLPESVAQMRRAIVDAAVACDFATLGELAGPDLTGAGAPTDGPVPNADALQSQLTGSCSQYQYPNGIVRCETSLEHLVRALGGPHQVVTDEDGPGVGERGFSGFVWTLDDAFTDIEIGITSDGDWRLFGPGQPSGSTGSGPATTAGTG
jgi:hypothetical protein